MTSTFAVTTSSPLPEGFVGAPYSQILAASGGVGAYSWRLADGSTLPAGLSLGTDGTLGGTPTTAGTQSFTVQVADANGVTAVSEFSLTVNAARPDLIPTAVSGPSAGTRGKNINVSATVRNQGQAKAGNFTVTFCLSADPIITADDVELGSKNPKSLEVDSSATVGGNLSIPKSMAPGGCYIGVIVDPAGMVAETDEGNNSRSGNAIVVT